MKLIHCADLHLGSKMQAKLPAEKAEERRQEVRKAFENMVEAAEREGVQAVLICGDAFDGDRPNLTDKQLFYRTVEAHGDITFFYLRGNHDSKESGGYAPANLKTFGDEWTTYAFKGVNITGAEWSKERAERLYATLDLPKDGVNILLLHGDIGGEIDLKRLQNKNVDYLALGHIHTFSKGELGDRRGFFAYSGCLEGRGFDECGKKGFVLLDVNTEFSAERILGEEKISLKFVPTSIREISEYRVDISEAKDGFEVRDAVRKAVTSQKKDMIRVYLTGERSVSAREAKTQAEEALFGYYFATVKDETRVKCDYSLYEAEQNSLRGEYVRTVLASEDLTAEEKDEIIRLGIDALNGEERE